MLLPVFDYVHHSGLLKKQLLLKTFVSHKELVDILENGNPEQFRAGMRNHLENHFARIFDLWFNRLSHIHICIQYLPFNTN